MNKLFETVLPSSLEMDVSFKVLAGPLNEAICDLKEELNGHKFPLRPEMVHMAMAMTWSSETMAEYVSACMEAGVDPDDKDQFLAFMGDLWDQAENNVRKVVKEQIQAFIDKRAKQSK